ncbi:MAG TPA: hypothetical protein VFQ05_17420 [Candidatus Eisenbacteria bacterium]|nr:hypothetical protein [Candidatus Eisenbacteria bacterium]
MTRRSSPNRRTPQPARKEPAPSHATAAPFRWPTLGDLLDPRAPYLIPAALLLITRIGLALYIPFAAEDAYITFRYARNFANGFGLVFNPGEHVFGFSSPLWTLWLAVGIKLGAPPVPWARLSTLALEVVALVVVTTMLRRAFGNRSAWCFAFFFAVWPYFGAASVSGMENQAMIGLMALAAAWCGAKNPLSGLALAALALMRPEGMVASAIVAGWARWRDRWIAIGLVGAAVIALAVYFGSPIPQSLIAKSQIYGTPGPWAGRHWWEWMSPFTLFRFPQISDTGHLFLLAVVAAPSAWIGARALWTERSQPLASFIAAGLAVWLGYSLLGVAYFWWYLAVPLAALGALAAVGFPRVSHGRALEISTGLLVAGLWTVVPNLYLGRAQSEYLGFGRVANFLRERAQPGAKVFLEPIGMVGFNAPVQIVDEVGLVSPQVAARRMQGPGWYADVVSRERPDWLVVRRGVVTGGQAFAGAGAPFRSAEERAAVFGAYTTEAVADTVAGANMLLVMSRRR